MSPQRVVGCFSGGGFPMFEICIGVLQALEQKKIRLSAYRGASAGSIISAMSASGMSGLALEMLIRKTPVNELINRNLWSMFIPFWRCRSIYSRDGMQKLINETVDDTKASALVTVSITEEESEKSLLIPGTRESVMASSAIPEIFEPVTINCVNYVDGGVKNNIPTPRIVEIQNWDLIIITMCCPSATTYTNAFKASRAIKWFEATMEREFEQVRDDWTGVPNAIIIRPPAPDFEFSMLSWSKNFQLISYAREYTLTLL